MRTAVSMLGLYDPDIHREATTEINRQRARSITAKIGVIAAYFHRARKNLPLPPIRDTDAIKAFDNWLTLAPRLNRLALRALLLGLELAPRLTRTRTRWRRLPPQRRLARWVYEHADLLQEALLAAQKRLLIISPWVKKSVVTTDFLALLERRLRSHVEVTIAHGIGDDDEQSDESALARLDHLYCRLPA